MHSAPSWRRFEQPSTLSELSRPVQVALTLGGDDAPMALSLADAVNAVLDLIRPSRPTPLPIALSADEDEELAQAA
jgi:hypothetical protein